MIVVKKREKGTAAKQKQNSGADSLPQRGGNKVRRSGMGCASLAISI